MNYLQPSEYETYGLDATTGPAWVTAASAIIDAHCRRITLGINQYTERLRTEWTKTGSTLLFAAMRGGSGNDADCFGEGAICDSAAGGIGLRSRFVGHRSRVWNSGNVGK